MYRIFSLAFVLSVLALGFSCGGTAPAGSSSDSPTEAYKRLFAAVKSKDTEAIKKEMSEKSLEFAKMASARNNTPIEKVFENGFTATTFSPTLPEIRDQRVSGDSGAVEVWNSKDSKWEDLPFVKENGSWKFAIGELFGGTFVSPGKGRDLLEKEAANAAGKGPVPAPNPINSNAVANTNPAAVPANMSNVKVIVPKPATNVNKSSK